MKTYEVINATRGSGLTATQRLLLIHVAYRAGEDGACWASATTLAADTGLDEKTVRVNLRQLVELAVLTADHQPGRSTVYRLTGHTPGATPGHPGRQTRGTPRAPRPDTPGATPDPPRAPRPDTPGATPDDPIQEPIQGLDPGLEEQRAPARDAPPPLTEPDPLVLAELVALQEQDEPQHGLGQQRDRDALRRSLLRGAQPSALRALWAWSGESTDGEAEACRRGGWRRWSSLLRAPLGDARIASALAWDRAGRPRAGPTRPRRGQSTAGDGVVNRLIERQVQARGGGDGDGGGRAAVLGGHRGDRDPSSVVDGGADGPGLPGLGGRAG